MGGPHAYIVVSWLNNRGHCQCGWEGKRRWFRGTAVVDVIGHCQQFGHSPLGLPPVRRVAQAS